MLSACGGAPVDPPAPAASTASARDYEACRGGSAPACARLAERFERGGEAAVDWRRFRPLFQHVCHTPYPADPDACVAGALHGRACDLGRAASCAALGDLQPRLGGDGAAALYARACRGGHTASCGRAAAELGPARAREVLEAGCAAGDAAACAALADLLERGAPAGDGVTRDLPRARSLREEACRKDHGGACHALARMWLRGVAGPRDGARAWKLAARGCDLGDAGACRMWGRAHGDGSLGEPDMAKQYELHQRAAELFEAACDAGAPAACHALGQLLRVGDGVKEDRSRGLSLQLAACRGGHGPACSAWVTRGPHRVPLDGRGAQAVASACAAGDGAACLAVGYLGLASPDAPFERGCRAGDAASCSAYGIEELPPTEARRRALADACELGYGPGCYHMGVALEIGGDATDGDKATAAYARGCALAFAPSCTRLGAMQQQGYVVEGSAGPRAAFERACGGGDRAGCVELARLLREGSAEDAAAAEGMLARACGAGSAEACAELGAAKLASDPTAAAELLQKACAAGAASACMKRASALAGGARKPWLDEAVSAARARCSALRAHCGGQLEPSGVSRGWVVYDDAPSFVLTEAPACGVVLERACVGLRDALLERCTGLDAGCFDAAAEIRELAGAGLSIGSAPADAADRRGAELADKGCKKGVAADCAALARAHREGRGVARDERKAERLSRRACQLEPALCPPE
jgi:hypothetical protein